MTVAQTEVELRKWLDRLAIQDLIYRYSDAVTRADWPQCEAVFCPDAIWESPGLGLRHESRASILEMLSETTTFDLLIQTPHSPVITLTDAHQAEATTTIHEFIRGVAVAESAAPESSSERNLEQYGIYFDDLARIDGEWKFTHRLFVPVYVGSGCVTGDVLTPRSALLRP
jgi:ketosteroid isomerase-like protein